MPNGKTKKKSNGGKAKKNGNGKPRTSVRKIEVASREAEIVWHYHPYRSFVEGLPLWLSLLTLYMFSVIYLSSWTFAIVFTLIIAILVALLFDLLHTLHLHLQISASKNSRWDGWFKRAGRGFLIGFTVYFLVTFILFVSFIDAPAGLLFMLGSLLSMIGIGLISVALVVYIITIIFLGFPRIRHQLSLCVLLFFCYFYLFFAFAVKRFAL